MNFLKKAVIVLVVIVGLLYAGGLMIPADYGMERSVMVEAPPQVVYEQVNELKSWPKWSPWTAMDPEMSVTYGEATSGKGAWYSWEGPETGTGKLTIIKDLPHDALNMELDFGNQGVARADWTFEPKGTGTEVTWKFSATASSTFEKYMGLLIEDFLAPMYEDGLDRLKNISEQVAANQSTDEAALTAPATANPQSENP